MNSHKWIASGSLVSVELMDGSMLEDVTVLRVADRNGQWQFEDEAGAVFVVAQFVTIMAMPMGRQEPETDAELANRVRRGDE